MPNYADDLLADIFGVPKNKTTLENDEGAESVAEETQEGAYAEFSEEVSNKPYEEKARALKQSLGSESADVEFVDVPPAEAKEVQAKASPSPAASKPEEVKHETSPSPAFERILDKAIQPGNSRSTKSEQMETEPNLRVPDPVAGNEHSDDSEVRAQPEQPVSPLSKKVAQPFMTFLKPDSKTLWLLESPGSMYDELYEAKIGAMPIFLVGGGEIDFDALNNELINARVDIKEVTTETRELTASKMKEVQMWRDRVVEIKRQVSSQYYALKSALRLLRGKLSRIQYEKPADPKQEGVNFDHLRDFELYFGRVEATLENCKDILYNLNNCFETLSRIGTLGSFDSKLLSSYDTKMSNLSHPSHSSHPHLQPNPSFDPQIPQDHNDIKRDLSNYDSIEETIVNASSKPAQKPISKSKEVDWLGID